MKSEKLETLRSHYEQSLHSMTELIRSEMHRADFWKQHFQEWISVSQAMPEPGVSMLTWDGLTMEVAIWDGDEWVATIGEIFPTHWKHLPDSPPHDEEDDEEENEGKTVLKWFSVEERMPPIDSYCMATDGSQIREAYFDEDGRWCIECGIMEGVTHWMPAIPLPE